MSHTHAQNPEVFKTLTYYLTYSEVSRHCCYTTISLIHLNAEIICVFKGSCFFSVYIILKSKVVSIYTELYLVFRVQHYQQKYLSLALMLISPSTDEGFVTPDPVQFLCKTCEKWQRTEGHTMLFQNNRQHTFMGCGSRAWGNEGKSKVVNETQAATLSIQQLHLA